METTAPLGLLIVEDDTYAWLAPAQAPRVAALDQLQHTVYISGFSKILTPSWRVGYLAAPPALVDRLIDAKLLSTLTTPSMTELALAHCLELGLLRRHAERVQRLLDAARSSATSGDLVRLADRLSYRRYWVAEHHNMPAVAATNPPVLIAMLAWLLSGSLPNIQPSDNRIAVANVVNQTYDAANATLVGQNLLVQKQYEVSDTVPIDSVIRTDPAAGTMVGKNTLVVVYVSSGKTQISMPDLKGMNEQMAKDAIEQAGLVLGIGHGVRDQQDDLAMKSNQRAAAAIAAGRLADEIVPVSIPQRKGDPIEFAEDEGIRANTTAESLAGLKPAFTAMAALRSSSRVQPLSTAACARRRRWLLSSTRCSSSTWATTWRATRADAGPNTTSTAWPSKSSCETREKQGTGRRPSKVSSQLNQHTIFRGRHPSVRPKRSATE